MPVTEVIDGLIDIIEKNMIAQTNVTSNVLTGTNVVNVINSFHFNEDEEVVLIDYGYNDPSSPHYQVFEYARIKEVANTRSIILHDDVVSDWFVSEGTFIQKTIGHSPLYSDRVYYGDREVIPSEDMAITVEPLSLSNEWIYIQGGLSEEYRVSITIYGKDINTEEGLKILNKYTDSVYKLLNDNLHIDINNYETPILANVAANATTVIIEDNVDNRQNILPSLVVPDDENYKVQDNQNIEIDLYCTSVARPGDGKMYVNISQNNPVQYGVQGLQHSYSITEFAVFRRHGRYFYDSRVDNVEYGMIQKGSAFIRAARLNWFGKEVNELHFPQKSKGVETFSEVIDDESSSSSSSGP